MLRNVLFVYILLIIPMVLFVDLHTKRTCKMCVHYWSHILDGPSPPVSMHFESWTLF